MFNGKRNLEMLAVIRYTRAVHFTARKSLLDGGVAEWVEAVEQSESE